MSAELIELLTAHELGWLDEYTAQGKLLSWATQRRLIATLHAMYVERATMECEGER